MAIERQNTFGIQAEKLEHPLLEVRRRSLQSLDFKVKQGLVQQDGFLKDRSVLRHLLALLKFEDNGAQLDASALLLLQRIASTFPAAGRQLLQLGAEDVLRRLKPIRPPDMQQLIDNCLISITTAPMQHETPLLPSAGTGTSITGSTSATGWRSSVDGMAALSMAASRAPAIIPPHTQPLSSQPQTSVSAASIHASGHTQPVARPLEQEFASAVQATPASRMRQPLSMPSAVGWTPAKSHSNLVDSVTATPSHFSGVMDTAPAKPIGAGPAWDGFSVRQGASSQPTPAAPPTTAPAYLSQDAQAVVARMRQERSGGAPSQGLVASLSTSVPADVSDWLLPAVCLSPSDEQYLFELIVRLKYLEDPDRIVAPAVLELLACCTVDFPAEVLVTRPGLLDQLLLILCTPGACNDPQLQASTADLLYKLLRGLKHSLHISTDPMLAPTSQSTTTTTAAPGSAVKGGSGAGGAIAGTARHGYGPSLSSPRKPGTAAAAAGQPPTYPQPLPQVPEYAQQGPALHRFTEQEGALNVTALAHALALQLLPVLRLPNLHFYVLPIVEELLPLLLVGRSGSLALSGSEGLVQKWTALMGALSNALLANIAIARSESPAMLQALQDDDQAAAPPVINPPTAALLVLIARCLRALPRDLWCPEVVPPAISDALAAVARDELLCTALPEGWREAVLPVLARLRPDVGQVLAVAEDGDKAVAAAQQLEAELPHLLAGAVAPASWLSILTSSLLALDLAVDQNLLQVMLQGLSFVCSSRSVGDQEAQARAEGALLSLLCHPLPAVSLAAYGMLERLVSEARGVPDAPVIALMLRPLVLQHLAAPALSEPRLRTCVGRMLQELLQRAEMETNTCLVEWASWVRCYSEDTQAGALAASLESVTTVAVAALPDQDWCKTRAAVVALFARKADARQGGSQLLRDVIYAGSGLHVSSTEPHTSDPFKAVLDDGARDDFVLSGMTPGAPGGGSTGAGGGGDGAARLAKAFKSQDADNLISILGNSSLAPELRRSAAEQLTTLASEPRLASHMSQPQYLDQILQAMVPPGLLGAHDGNGRPVQAPTAAAILGNLDMALPVAACNLLFALACASPEARAWVLSEQGGLHMLRLSLPLVFHNLITVRRAVGRLLAAVVLQGEADRWGGWAKASLQHGQALALRLPRPFAACYTLPCKVAWVEVAGAAPMLPAGTARPHYAATAAASTQHTSLDGQPLLQGMVAEQRAYVALLVEERRLANAAGFSLTGVLRELSERPGMWRLSPAATHACAANIQALSLSSQVSSALAAVADAGSHAECSSALQSLSLLASTYQGLAALVAADWADAFDRLLTNSPANGDDRALWLELLPLVQRMLASGLLSSSQLLHLSLCLQQSALSILSEPSAATELTPVPVALAGSIAVSTADGPDGTSLACVPMQASMLRTTLAALQTLVGLLQAVASMTAVGDALRTVHALGLPALLKLLTSVFLEGPVNTHYGCRVQAAGVLQAVLGLLRAQALLPDSEHAPSLQQLQSVLVSTGRALLLGVCHGPKPGMAGQPLPGYGGGSSKATGTATAVAAAAGSFRGKALLRAGMQGLLHCSNLLPVPVWSPVFEEVSGVFWLSRGIRDRDSGIRAASWQLLAVFLGPSALHTRNMVAEGWPDAPARAVRAAMDGGEPYGVRGAALRVLCCMLGLPPSIQAEGQASLTSGLLPMTPEALLKQNHLWDALPGMVRDKGTPPNFLAAALSLLLQVLVVDVEAFAAHVILPGMLSWLLKLVSAEGQAQLMHAGAVGACADAVGVAALGGFSGAGVLGRPLGTWPADPCSTVLGTASMAPTGLQLQLVAPKPPNNNSSSSTHGSGSNQAADTGAGNRATGVEEGMRTVKSCTRVVPSNTPLCTVSSGREGGAGAAAAAWTVSAVAAQVMGVGVMESEHVSLDAAGHPPSQLLVSLLVVLCNHGSDIRNVDREVGSLVAEDAAAVRCMLGAVQQAVVVASNLAHICTPQDLAAAVAKAEARAQSPGSVPLLVALSELLTAACVPPAAKLSLACLLATLLSHGSLAGSLLHEGGRDECSRDQEVEEEEEGGGGSNQMSGSEPEHIAPSTGEAVGSQLCLALVDLIPPDALTISRDERGRPVAEAQALEGEALVHVVALRNLLAHSSQAKAAAVRAGLHSSLLLTCTVAAQALALAAQRPASTTTPQHHPAAPRRPTHAPPSLPPSRRSTAPNTPAAVSKGIPRGSLPSGAAASQSQQRPSSAAQIVGSGSELGEGLEEEVEEEVWEGTDVAGWVSSISDTSRPSTPHRPPVSVGRHGVGWSVSHNKPPGAHAARSSVAGSVAGGPSAAAGTAGALLLRFPALEKKVTVALSLLKHMTHRSPYVRGVLLREGVMGAVRGLWGQGFTAYGGSLGGTAACGKGGAHKGSMAEGSVGRSSGVHVTASPALHELLGLLTNLMPGCPEARAALAEEGSPTLLQSVLVLLFEHKMETPTWTLVTGLVGHMATTPDGCTHLLRARTTAAPPARGAATSGSASAARGADAPPLPPSGAPGGAGSSGCGGGSGVGFLAPAYRLLSDMVAACVAGVGSGGSGRGGAKDTLARTLSLMQVFVSMAAHPEGARALLKSGACPGLLEVMLVHVLDPRALCVQALLLVRNLCFSPDAKPHLLAHPSTLTALVAHAERAGEAPQAATTAASALWALCWQGEKVKSALRRVPSALQRLEAARAAAQFQVCRLTKAAAASTHTPATAPSKGEPAAAETPTPSPPPPSPGSALSWLQQAVDTLTAVLAVMAATAPTHTGVGTHRGGSTGASPAKPTWAHGGTPAAVAGGGQWGDVGSGVGTAFGGKGIRDQDGCGYGTLSLRH